jgi:glutaredoxin
MRCLVCGHVRTRLDPLPDTVCAECGTEYAAAVQQVAAGLIKPKPTPAQARVAARQRDSVRLGAGAIALLAGAGLVRGYLGRDVEAPIVGGPPKPDAVMSGAISPEREGGQSAAPGEQPLVVVYTTAWCKVCARTRSFLTRNGIRFDERDVERSPQAWREYKQYAGEGVPLIVIGDDVMRGHNERWLRSQLGPWLGRRNG